MLPVIVLGLLLPSQARVLFLKPFPTPPKLSRLMLGTKTLVKHNFLKKVEYGKYPYMIYDVYQT